MDRNGPTTAHTTDRPRTSLDAATRGRRERKKQETHRRIFEAAASCSREGVHGRDHPGSRAAADVGAGTLFRYARNKAELLIMMMNERLRLGAESGLGNAERGSSPADSIFGLIEPLVQAFLSQPENTAMFQREVLFGADGPYRAEALNRIRRLEAAMATILNAYTETHATRPGAEVRRAASVDLLGALHATGAARTRAGRPTGPTRGSALRHRVPRPRTTRRPRSPGMSPLPEGYPSIGCAPCTRPVAPGESTAYRLTQLDALESEAAFIKYLRGNPWLQLEFYGF